MCTDDCDDSTWQNVMSAIGFHKCWLHDAFVFDDFHYIKHFQLSSCWNVLYK